MRKHIILAPYKLPPIGPGMGKVPGLEGTLGWRICVGFYSGSAGSKSMITEAVKRGVPTYVVSISEKVGIGELFKVDDCKKWERVKKMF